MNGKDYANPDNVKAVAHICLRHRIWLTFRADSEWIDQDYFISKLLENVKII